MPGGAFKIADAYVKVDLRYDDDQVARAVEGALKGSEPRIRSASRKQGKKSSTSFGQAFFGSLKPTLTAGIWGSFSDLPKSFASAPWATSAGVALGTTIVGTMLPAIGGLISAGVGIGGGLSVLGLGALLLKDNPDIQKAAHGMADGVLMIFRDAAGVLVQPFVEAFNRLGEIFTGDKVAPQLREMFSTMAQWVIPLTDAFGKMAENILPGFVSMLKDMGPVFQQLAVSLPQFGQALGDFFKIIGQGGPETARFLGDFFVFLDSLLTSTAYAVYGLTKAYGALHEFFAVAFPSALSTTWSFLKMVGSAVGDFFTGIWNWITDAVGRIGGWISNIGTMIGNGVSAIVGWFQALPGRIMEAIAALPGLLNTALDQAITLAFTTIGEGLGMIVQAFLNLPGAAANAVSSLWGAISGAFHSARDQSTGTIRSLVDQAVSSLFGLPGRAAGAVSSLWGWMSGHFYGARDAAVNAVWSLVNGTVGVLWNLPGRAASAASAVRGGVIGAFSGAASWLYSAGMDIIRGVGSGIEAMIGWAVDKAKRAASSVVNGFKSALGIASKSKVMAEQVGKWIPPGITSGVESALPAMHARMRELVPTTIVDAVTPARGTSGSVTYVFQSGALSLDVSKLKTMDEVIRAVNGLVGTARQYRVSGVTT